MGSDSGAAKSASRDALLKQRLRQYSHKRQPDGTAVDAVRPPSTSIELSPNQHPFWVDYRMNPDHRTAWIIRGYLLDGVVDTDRLADTLARLKARHWNLCCLINSDGMVQRRDAAIPLEIVETDNEPWIAAQRYVRTRFEPFQLEQGKLFRAYVFQGKEQSAVVLAIHHVLADHDGMDVLSRDLDRLYAGDDTGLPPVSDFVAAFQQQRSEIEARLPELQKFWRDRLEELPAVTPLPLARTNPEPARRNGALVRHDVDPELASRCRNAALTAGVSPSQWFLAAWVVLLARYYNRDDIHLGTLLSMRDSTQKNAVAHFQNVFIFRTQLEKAETFSAVLASVRSTLGKAIANGGLPVDEVARLIPGRTAGAPLFSTAFTLVTAEQTQEFLGHKALQMEELDYGGTAFDLTFFVIVSGNQLSFAIEFDTAIYDRESVSGVFDHYESLLTQVAADVGTDWRRCSLLSIDTLEKRRAEWQQISATPPPEGRLEDAFYEHARLTPDAIALRWDGDDGVEQLRYAELAARADAIASFIDSVADANDTIVAIIGSWQPHTVAALIGTLRSGRAYLPVAMDYPADRIEHILSDAGRPLVLKQRGVQTPPGYADRSYNLEEAINSETAANTPAPANDIAYVIYTSGSSGMPKGVRVGHSAALYSAAERQKVYADWPPETFLLLSSFAFDSAVAGLWWSLSSGACLRLIDRDAVRAADTIADIIARENISHTLCLPSQWSDICRISHQRLDSMRLVIVAGEACRSTSVDHHFERSSGAALFNEYGPTEMTVWSTYCRLGPDAADPIPIGRPLAMTQALIVDESCNPVPHGLSGELVLSGHGIAEGYVGHTQGGFISHPLDQNGRAYRTGDVARVGSDGLIRFLGRTDQQVKFRGYRIGVEAIEQTLSNQGTEVALIPWDGMSLEDLLAELPEHDALALVDKYLRYDDVQTPGRQTLRQGSDRFQLMLDIESGYVAPPREAQRAWLLRKAMREWTEDLTALDQLATQFVAGKERLNEADFQVRARSEFTDASIMEDWQIPIMRAMAAIVGRSGGDVLEIGFGRGISAEFIHEFDVSSHTIVEAEPDVVDKYFRPWRRKHSEKNIRIHIRKWQKCNFSPQSFDAILFHAYPLDEAEFFEHIVDSVTYAEHAVPAMAELLREGGRFTYLSNEIDSLSRSHQRLLLRHFRQFRVETIDLEVPDDTYDAYWAPKMVIVEAVR